MTGKMGWGDKQGVDIIKPNGKSINITMEFSLLPPLYTEQMFYLKEVSKLRVEGRAAGVYLEHTEQ